jgi:hypothetical protein
VRGGYIRNGGKAVCETSETPLPGAVDPAHAPVAACACRDCYTSKLNCNSRIGESRETPATSMGAVRGFSRSKCNSPNPAVRNAGKAAREMRPLRFPRPAHDHLDQVYGWVYPTDRLAPECSQHRSLPRDLAKFGHRPSKISRTGTEIGHHGRVIAGAAA